MLGGTENTVTFSFPFSLLWLEFVEFLFGHRTREVVALGNRWKVKEMWAKLKLRGPEEHQSSDVQHPVLFLHLL